MSDAPAAPLFAWPDYYVAVRDKPPRPTLLEALQRFDSEANPRDLLAVDLGCGGGRDTVELLRRGWRVLAIDSEPAAIDQLQPLRAAYPTQLETRLCDFQSIAWPTADLINASYALPFCPPVEFPMLWQHIVGSLQTGGRFAGQMFGPRDGWRGARHLTFVSREGVVRLLEGFEIELLLEEEVDRPTALGYPKHWHIFDIVARKLAQR